MSKATNERNENPPTLASRLQLAATVVFALNVLVALVFIIGCVAGWFSMSVGKTESGSMQIAVAMHPAEAAHDIEHSIKAAAETKDAVASAVDQQTARGEVLQVTPVAKTFRMKDEDKGELTLAVTEITGIQNDDEEAALNDLVAGRTVRVVYKEKDDKLFALEVTQVPEDTE